MHDRKPIGSILMLTLPAVLVLGAAWVLCGEELRDAVFAVLKLVVIR